MSDELFQNKRFFVACPLGNAESSERRKSDLVLKHIVYPALEGLIAERPEEVVIRSDKIGDPGRITTQILHELVNADVVIADLTGTNPNVMYEVGIRQAQTKPYVLIAEDGQHLPFDLSDFRTVFYQLDLDSVEEAQRTLRSHLTRALTGGGISTVDQTLFSQHSDPSTTAGSTDNSVNTSGRFLEILEACSQILRETQETKELLNLVGSITVEARDLIKLDQENKQQAQSQEMGMWLFQQMLANPEGIDKVMPAIQTFIELGKEEQKGKNLE